MTVDPTCTPLLLKAGVFGNRTMAPEDFMPSTAIASSSSSASLIATDNTDAKSGSHPHFGSGYIATIVIAGVLAVLLAVCSLLLWRRRNARKATGSNKDSEGLEVGKTPPGLGHARNVELDNKGPTPELSAQPFELANLLTSPESDGSTAETQALTSARTSGTCKIARKAVPSRSSPKPEDSEPTIEQTEAHHLITDSTKAPEN